MVGSEENYKFDVGVKELIVLFQWFCFRRLIEMDDKTKACWNWVMGDHDWAENYSTGGRGRNNPELWQTTTLNKVTAQYGAAW